MSRRGGATATDERSPARLSAEARRSQLLDVTAELVMERGAEALTMEAVALRAGVSKGLGYAYFANKSELLLALLKREGAELDRRVIEAVQSADGFEAQVRGSLRAYLDVVKERGGLLAVLSQTRLIEGDVEDFRRGRQRAAQEFYGRLIAERYALRPRVAGLAATMLLTAADGALDAWVTGRAPRQQIEETYVRFALAGLAALEAGNGNGRAAASGDGQSRRTHRPRR